MVETRHSRPAHVRTVTFQPSDPSVSDVEVRTIESLLTSGGRDEFVAPQRLGFDILLRIRTGSSVHTVDFTEYPIRPGDVVWIRADQVQQWGELDKIDGDAILFTAHALDLRVHEFVRDSAHGAHNHWPGIAAPWSLTDSALSLLRQTDQQTHHWQPAARAEAMVRAVATIIVHLAATQPVGLKPREAPSEVFRWFRDEVDLRFRSERSVRQYAERLGYATRTLDRVTLDATGATAKQFIDRRVLLEAKRLLAHSDHPVVQIADELGFSDAANFSKYFAQRAGETPAGFRQGFLRTRS